MPNPIKNCANPDCKRRVYHRDREYCAKCWQRFTVEGRDYNAQRQRDHAAKTKAHFAAVAAMKAAPLLLICAGAGWADVLPPDFQVRHTDHNSTPQASAPVARPNRGVTSPVGLPPVGSPALRGGAGAGLIYDSPVTGRGPVSGPVWIAGIGASNSWRTPIRSGGSAAGGGGRSDA